MSGELENLQDVITALMNEGWHERPSGAAADRLRATLMECASSGGQWASIHLLQWEHEGARRRWNMALRAEKQRFKSHSGEILEVSGAYATQVRNDSGLPTGEYQPHLFMTMTRDELEESVRADERQHDRLGAAVFVKRCLLALWTKYPEAGNIGDLLRAAGIDPSAGLIEGVV